MFTSYSTCRASAEFSLTLVLQKQLNVLTVSLSNGVLTDSDGRTGYIAANSQFQFDKPAQTGAIYTAGWSVCGNGSLAIGGTAVFQGCLSGTFYNLYLHNDAAQCSPIYIVATGGSGSVNTIGDGQPTGSAVNPICQQTDGQPAITGCASAAVSQMSDGQVLATSAASASAAVSQISDGQIQATTAVAPPYTTSRAVASTGVKPTPVASGSGIPVAQISDGQVQATTAKATVTTPPSASSAAAYTGAAMPTAAAAGVELFGLAAGVLAVAML